MSDFNPKKHLIKMSGKEYLETKWRIAWFREDHPKGRIHTEIYSTEPIIVRAVVYTEAGEILASAHGGATDKGNNVWSGHNIEKAETAAIGRALGHAGYGTQFATSAADARNADSLNQPVDNPVQNGKKHETVFNKSATPSRVRDWSAIFKAVEHFYTEETEEKRKGHWWGTVQKFQKANALADAMTDKAIIDALTAYKSGRGWQDNAAVRALVEHQIGMPISAATKQLKHGVNEYATPDLFIESVEGLPALNEISSKVTA